MRASFTPRVSVWHTVSDLSVVISSFDGNARSASRSVLSAAARAEAEVELIVVGHGCRVVEPEPATNAVQVLPLGAGYARNRGLALASAELVVFIDDGIRVGPGWVAAILAAFAQAPAAAAVVGPVSARPSFRRAISRNRLRLTFLPPPGWAVKGISNVAFRRSMLLELRGFDQTLGDAPVSAAEDAEIFLRIARRRGHIAWTPSMSASRASSHQRERYGPRKMLDLMPESVLAALPSAPEPLSVSHRAKTHFLYRAGADRLLHLYANPADRLRRSLAERETLRARAAQGGIPRLHLAVDDVDAVWVLEELMPGSPPKLGAPDEWFSAVTDWMVGMAGPGGRRLSDVPMWRDHCEEVVLRTPSGLSASVRQALDVVSQLPAVHMHGDLQRRNILIDVQKISAVDWEGAWLEGLPGLDLVYLALFAAGDTPDPSVIATLARGDDVPWGGLHDRLREVGVGDEILPSALLAMLGTWALAEDRRRERLGAPPAGEPLFRPLFHRLAAGSL